MKTYRVILLAKVVFSVFYLALFIVSLYGVIHGEDSFLMMLFGIIVVVFSPLAALISFTLQIKVFADRVEVKSLPFIPVKSLNWDTIAEVRSDYVLFPETGFITLIPRAETGKKSIVLTISGMPIELVRDILAYVPKDAKIHLYPYLKRRAEGKQIIFYKK